MTRAEEHQGGPRPPQPPYLFRLPLPSGLPSSTGASQPTLGHPNHNASGGTCSSSGRLSPHSHVGLALTSSLNGTWIPFKDTGQSPTYPAPTNP